MNRYRVRANTLHSYTEFTFTHNNNVSLEHTEEDGDLLHIGMLTLEFESEATLDIWEGGKWRRLS